MISSAPQQVSEFFRAYPPREIVKDEIIARAGQELPGVMYLEEGRIAQYDIANDGRQIVVNIFQPPAFFPMSWAINNTPNDYFFQAKLASRLRCAPPGDVVQFLKANPEVMFDLLSRVYRGTDGVIRRMAHALGGKASTLLLFEIIVSCQRFGTRQKDGYSLAITEQELASHTGLSRETVNRELQALKREGLLTLGYGNIQVPDLKLLDDKLGSRL